jgi:TonB-dependent receptor
MSKFQASRLRFTALVSMALMAPWFLGADVSATAEGAAASPTAEAGGDSGIAESQLETVVVKAKGINQASAFNQMHDSLNKVNVLSQEQIDQTPAKTVAQAVQQLPGVGVQHDEGEPIFMEVRGTDQNLNVITYDESLIPSYVPSQRAVEISDIPVGVVSNMELYKVILPNMDAQGIGGQLNLVPKSALTYPHDLAELGLEGGYAPMHTDYSYVGNLTVGHTFDLGGASKLGVLVTGNYEDKKFGIDDLEETYSSDNGVAALSPKSISQYSFRWYQFDRERAGVGTNLDLSVDDNNKYYLHFFGSGYDEWREPKLVTNYNDLDVVSGDTINPDGSFTIAEKGKKQINAYLTHVLTLDRTYDAVAGGENKFDNFVLDYKGTLAYASENEPDDFKYSFITKKNAVGGTITYNNSGNNGDNPSFNTSKLTGNSPSNIFFTEADNGNSDTFTRQVGLQADGKVDKFLGDEDGALKFGASARSAYTVYSQVNWENDAAGTALPLSQVLGPNYTYYPGNIYNMGATVSPNIYNLNLNPYASGWYQPDPVGDLAADWDSTENIYAGYAMYTHTFGNKLTLMGGVRVERTSIQYDWNNGYDSSGNELGSVSQVTAETGNIDYTDVLPSLGLKYDILPTLTSRLNYSETLARPTYSQYIPAVGQQDAVPGSDPSGVNTTFGNPNLQPMVSNNFDFSMEYYPQKGAILAVDAFVKDIDNYFTTDYSRLDNGSGSTITFTNIPNSQIYGVELQYQQQYTMLPWGLDGLGFRGAIDRNWSQGQTTPGLADTELPSQADLVWNAGVFYKKAGWTFDIGGNFTGKNLYLVGDENPDHPGGPVPNIYYDNYFQVDAKLQYAINTNFKLHVDANNINNAPLRFYQDPGTNYPLQCEYYGPSYDAGITYDY